jgi:hypothetical protein
MDATGKTPSIRPEVLECLVDGLHFLRSDTSAPAQKLAKRVLANIIIEHLDISGYGIHRKTLEEEIPEAEISYSIPAI